MRFLSGKLEHDLVEQNAVRRGGGSKLHDCSMSKEPKSNVNLSGSY